MEKRLIRRLHSQEKKICLCLGLVLFTWRRRLGSFFAIDKIAVSLDNIIMKKLILSCLILVLALVSCSPKQKNKNISTQKPITNIGLDRLVNNGQDTSKSDIRHNLTTITEKGAKVVLKDFGDYGTVLVTYNGDDIWVEIYNLLKTEAVVMLQNDNKIIDLDYCQYFNQDTIKVYKECNKESESFLVSEKNLRFHKIQGINDWLYSRSDNYPKYEEFGFVYIYDISEKSFYGNIEERKKRNSYFDKPYVSEYEIIQRYKNIKRYGSLLTINHNNKTVEFWDTFLGLTAEAAVKKYLLLDYYPDYNEVLIYEQGYENSRNFIFNLESEKSVCFVEIPYFNNSRTYMITMLTDGRDWRSTLRIYAINNGLYNTLKEIEFNWQAEDEYIDIKNIVWLNDNNAQITLDNSTSMLIEIGKEIKITRKP
jgi:hypothetical protein